MRLEAEQNARAKVPARRRWLIIFFMEC